MRFSGDLVKHTQDGLLCYVGRQDDVIKRHGKRVHLHEIEQVTSSLPVFQRFWNCVAPSPQWWLSCLGSNTKLTLTRLNHRSTVIISESAATVPQHLKQPTNRHHSNSPVTDRKERKSLNAPRFRSHQLHTSRSCKTTDMGLVHYVVCPFTPQHSRLLINSHAGGMACWVGVRGQWLSHGWDLIQWISDLVIASPAHPLLTNRLITKE